MAYADELPKSVIAATIAKVRAAGRKGLIVPIGEESRALQLLVEDGVVWQTIHSGGHYKFTMAK